MNYLKLSKLSGAILTLLCLIWPTKTQWLQIGVILLSLMVLFGCSTPPPKIVTVDRIVIHKQKVPPVLLLDCEKPNPSIKTNSDLIIYISDLSKALEACNGDKQLIKEWSEQSNNK